MQTALVKICGLRTPEDVAVVANAGASFCGFTFVPRSSRAVHLGTAAQLSALVPQGLRRVALTVDADDALLDAITAQVGVDMLQLHGHETPDRVLSVKDTYGIPVMKAVGVADAADVAAIGPYAEVADWILLDAKPPTETDLPGGNGLSFDWRLLSDVSWTVPWMLAGGLTPENVGEAVARTGAPAVDVASGVETAPGVKDPDKICAFVAAAQG